MCHNNCCSCCHCCHHCHCGEYYCYSCHQWHAKGWIHPTYYPQLTWVSTTPDSLQRLGFSGQQYNSTTGTITTWSST